MNSISQEARTPTDDKDCRHGYLLAVSYEEENLRPTLRGDGGVILFFSERGINWWRNDKRVDAKGATGPTCKMASSQFACVNFHRPLAEIQGALTAFLRTIDEDVRETVTIEHQGNTSPVEFEWIGTGGRLEDDAPPTRGANTTSVDGFMVAETGHGRRAYLLEWKHVEEYPTRNYYLASGSQGETRLRRYFYRFKEESSSFNGIAPIEELLYEPFYQFMRQRLLPYRMAKAKELGVSEARVIAVVSEHNIAYRNRLTIPPLAQRFPDVHSVPDVFRATLKRADEAYGIVSPSVLVDTIEEACGSAAADWTDYQRRRYGWRT